MNIKVAFSTASSHFQKGHYTQALQVLNTLIDVDTSPKSYALLGKTLQKLGLKAEAAGAFELAGRQTPLREDYLREAVLLHFDSGNEDDALAVGSLIFPMALRDPDVAFVLATIMLRRRQKELLSGLKTVLANGSHLRHLTLAAKLLTDDLFDEGNRHIVATLVKRYPDNPTFRNLHLVFCREVSDMDAADIEAVPIQAAIAVGKLDYVRLDIPFFHLHWCSDEALNKLVVFDTAPIPPGLADSRRTMPHQWSDRIRIGYLSSDFFPSHATMKLFQRILQLHDRSRFEIVLFDHSRQDYQNALPFDFSEWGRVVDVRNMSDQAAAQIIRSNDIDILVDLKGHTKDSRARILNHMPAPIQVAWLGFPGSTVNIDIDYVIGDHYVLPDHAKPHYHEKFCRLPECYQPNDPTNRPKPRPTSRAQHGLPEDAFVYASFNGNRKITSQMVDVWCNILNRTKNTVLWLLCNGPKAETNLAARFAARGINRKRIVFTTRINFADHIDRQGLADLGIDTFPYNGHTTTSEQLWGGLPVLTLKGTNFASRVSESLLHAIGLPELVAADMQGYEDMAVELANDAARVRVYKDRLIQNRYKAPLFDAERFCDHLETAYQTMYDRGRQGLEPDHFDVPALPARTAPFMVEDDAPQAVTAE